MEIEQINKLTLAFISITTVLFVVSIQFFQISSVTYAFLLIKSGKILGPIGGLIMAVAIPLLFLVLPSRLISRVDKNKSSKDVIASLKHHRKRLISATLIGLVLSFLVTFSLSIPLMSNARQAGSSVDAFVVNNQNKSLADYVTNLTDFLNNNLNSSYNRTEALFEIDGQLSHSLLDSLIMQSWNVTNADVILFQGWGSCGQAAILLAQVMHDSGYESRIAHFKGVDHEWAEVNNGTNWVIVDPWYIGNLVDIQELKSCKPAFEQATGVEIQTFDNPSWVDASKEHGY
jgi:hypothetical protein